MLTRQDSLQSMIDEGTAHHERGQFWQAESLYRQVLRADPQNGMALGLMGALAEQRGHHDLALQLLDRAVVADPEQGMHHQNRGAALYALGRYDEAIEAYLTATDVHSGYALAYFHLYAAYMELARHEEALYAIRLAAKYSPGNDIQAANLYTSVIFALDASSESTAEDVVDARREFNDRFCEQYRAEWPDHQNDPDPDRRLKVGYVGADFYNHSAATGFGLVLFNHDKSRYHVTIYSGTVKHDISTADYQAVADAWHDIKAWSDEKLNAQIIEDQIDVLVDLSAFTAGGRLFVFARKPAPVQVTAWGYATGTGLAAMDALISDAIVSPPEHDWQASEKVVRLSSVIGMTLREDDPLHDIETGSVRVALGRRPTFGVFNRQTKINAGMFDAMADILKRVPEARLVIKNGQLGSASLREYTWKLFSDRGIEQERISLVGVTSRDEHLRWHNAVDVMLDPFPQGGGVTAMESLWMGVPYVSMLGDRATTRVGASMLHQVGLDDWIVGDREAYIDRAVAAIADKRTLIALRDGLRDRMLDLPLTNGPKYAREVEDAYRMLWREWAGTLNGLPVVSV